MDSSTCLSKQTAHLAGVRAEEALAAAAAALESTEAISAVEAKEAAGTEAGLEEAMAGCKAMEAG